MGRPWWYDSYWEKKSKPPRPPRDRIPTSRRNSSTSGWLIVCIVIFVLLLFGLVVWLLSGSQPGPLVNPPRAATKPSPQSPSTHVPTSTPTIPSAEEKQDTISPEIFLQNLLRDIHSLINQEREKHGLIPVNMNAFLSELAAEHCEEMVKYNYFSHERQPGYRDLDWQQQPGTIRGENIAYVPEREIIPGPLLSTQEIAQMTVDMWMSSPEHRENILGSDFEYTGLGVSYQDGYFYITQIFEGRMQ